MEAVDKPAKTYPVPTLDIPVVPRSHGGARPMLRKLRERRHLALLAALVLLAVIEPLAVDFSVGIQIIGGIVVVAINLGVFLIVFEQRWERRLALVMVAAILCGN